jgi:MFS family permease
LVVGDIKANLETGLSLGLPLKSLENAQSLIDTQAKQDPNILEILVHDENGAIQFNSGTKKTNSIIPQAWQFLAKGEGEKTWFFNEESTLVVATKLTGGISQNLGGVAIRYSMAAHQDTVRAIQGSLTLASLSTIFITALLSHLGIKVFTYKSDAQLGRKIVQRLLIFSLLLLLLSQASISLFAWSSLEKKLSPEIDKQAATVGKLIERKLQRALDYKIPFEKIEGVEEFFDDIRAENTDIRFLAISSTTGQVLSASGIAKKTLVDALKNDSNNDTIKTIKAKENSRQTGQKTYRDTTIKIRHGSKDIAIIHVGMDQNYFTTKIADLRYDIGIILLSSLLIAYEILLFIITRNFSHPMHQMSAAKGYIAAKDFRHRAEVYAIRILTFLFMFAEMLSRPFLPIYAKELLSSSFTISNAVLISLPVTGFLFGMAISMPIAGRYSDRFGRRFGFIFGALIVALGLLVSGTTTHFYLLVLARTLAGIGYASMFMSCQGYVLDKTTDQNRAQGMASFVSAIMVAEICAPAIGGILADKIGVRLVFIFGAMIAITAAALAISILDNKNAHRPTTKLAILPPYQQLMRNRRFIALALLSGIPAKLIYSAFLIYLVPLLLTDFSSTTSEIGRYAMVYGIAALLLSPVFAKLADRYQAHVAMVSCGGALTGLGLVPIFFTANKELVLLGIAALGIGQAMSISAQITMVGRLTASEMNQMGSGSVLGVFRLIERLGAAAGPLIAGVLVALFGVIPATAALGLYGLLSALFFALIFIAKKHSTATLVNENSKQEVSQNQGLR